MHGEKYRQILTQEAEVYVPVKIHAARQLAAMAIELSAVQSR